MADWPRWTSRQLLCFLSCAQFIIPLISVAPMEQLPTSAANAPGVYAAMHHTEPDAIPEGYSLVQTAQPGFHAVWRPFNVIVPAVVDYGGYEFHPGTLVTNQLVPNNNYQAPSHQRDRPVLREHAKPFNPSHSQEDQGRLPNRKPYKEKGPKRIGESASGASSSEHTENLIKGSRQDRSEKQPIPNHPALDKDAYPELSRTLDKMNQEENHLKKTSSIKSNHFGDNNPIDGGKSKTLAPEDHNLAGVTNDSGPSDPNSEAYKLALLKAIDDSNRVGKSERGKKQTEEMNVALHSMGTRQPARKTASKKYPSVPAEERLRIPTNRHATVTKNQNQRLNMKSAVPEKADKSSDGQVDNDVDGSTWKKPKNVAKATKQELKMAPWQILNHDSEPAADLTSPAPAVRESIPEEVGGEDRNEIQDGVQKSDEKAEVLKKDSKSPRKSPGNKKKQKKKNQSQVSNTADEEWQLLNEAHQTRKNAMMDQEKKLEEMTRDHETTQAKIPPPSFLDMSREFQKMSLQFQMPLGRQKIVYGNFYAAFHPSSSVKEKLDGKFKDLLDSKSKDQHEAELEVDPDIDFNENEDEIYPGIKRADTITEQKNKKMVESGAPGLMVLPPNDLSSSSKRGKRMGEVAKGNMLVEEKARANRRKSWDPEWEASWQEYNLDFNFMDTLLRYLKIQDKSKYLQLDDMSMDTYNVFRDAWTHNRIKFMQGQFWVNGILGYDESLRRLKTMIAHISEITLVENWKLIQKHLIKNNQLSDKEAKQIEKYLKLSIKFPNPTSTWLKPIPSPIITDHQRTIFESIKKSLGIVDTRPTPIRPRNKKEYSEIYNALPQLFQMSRTNGVTIDSIFAARTAYEAHPYTAADNFITLLNSHELVPWPISAEKEWLRKVCKLPS